MFRHSEGRERERNINVWLPLALPLLGTWPTTQACAPTGNRIGDPSDCRSALSPLSPTSQRSNLALFFIFTCRNENRDQRPGYFPVTHSSGRYTPSFPAGMGKSGKDFSDPLSLQ